MRALRSTLDQLARAALLHPDEGPTVDSLVEQAARLSHAGDAQESSVRDALLAVARSLDALDAASIGHGDRVGRLARMVAERLGCDAGSASAIELAARLHGLEAIGAEELQAIPSLREVGELVGWHGRGTKDRMPLAAQIVAAANAYDMLASGISGEPMDRRAAIDRLAEGGSFEIQVVRALASVVGVKSRAARRRRRADAVPEERGAA
jgi:HD-GYP domain-containing protein (c-di-GMP phosphodiesterase class II)